MKECWLYLLQPSILKKSRGFGKSHHFFVKFKIYSTYTKKKNNINPFQANVPLIEKPTKWMIITSKMFEKRQWKSDIWVKLQVDELYLYFKCHSSTGVFHTFFW